MGIRAFVAIDLPDAVRRDVAALRPRLGLGGAPMKWVEEKNLHLTVKFLGDVDDDAVPSILARLRDACAAFEPFEIEIAGVGTFPPGRPPRIVWAGVTENAEIVKRLAARIDKDLGALGIEPEARELHPHVTLARVRDGANGPPRARGPIGAGVGPLGRVRVEAVELKASRLGPAGPVYSSLGAAPLRGGT
jgi:2'-5' RNA ligase